MASSISGASIDHRAIAIQAMERKAGHLSFLAERVDSTFAASAYIGPSLNFLGCDPEKRLWKVSMMLTMGAGEDLPPHVRMRCDGAEREIAPLQIDEWNGYRFYRYDFTVKQGARAAKKIRYYVGEDRYKFYVPASGSPANMLFNSCNGVQTEKDEQALAAKGGLLHLWDAIQSLHKDDPFHLNVMDGDQCYMDGVEKVVHPDTGIKMYVPTGVLALPSILEWLKLPDDERNSFEVTPQMERELQDFYLSKYLLHFGASGNFSKTLASVPSVMQWGDHDSLDGIGSYPSALQKSPPMKAIRRIAQRAYLLFQQHSTHTDPEIHSMMKLFGGQGYSFLRDAGAGTFILGVDTRSERSRTQVVALETWYEIFEALETLPASCKTLLVMLELPIVYPSIKALGEFLNSAQDVFQGDGVIRKFERHILKKIPEFLNDFRLIEITDDVDDCWSAERHQKEREMVVVRLMEFAERRNIRVTFLGGDAHWAVHGFVGPDGANPDVDPRVMPQLVSSAIGNVPPPDLMVSIFNRYMERMNDRIAPNAYARMVPIAKLGGGSDGEEKRKLIHAKRNFAALRVEDGNIVWKLYVEPTNGVRTTDLGVYQMVVKALGVPGSVADDISLVACSSSGLSASSSSSASPRVPPLEQFDEERRSFQTARPDPSSPSLSKKQCCVLL